MKHTKSYTYLGLIISSSRHKLAMNDLGEKGRRAFYASKSNIPIRTKLKTPNTVIEPVILYGSEVCGTLTSNDLPKWEKHPLEALHAELC